MGEDRKGRTFYKDDTHLSDAGDNSAQILGADKRPRTDKKFCLSYQDLHTLKGAEIEKKAIAHSRETSTIDATTWERQVIEEVNRLIKNEGDGARLSPVPANSCCNLYVTFCFHKPKYKKMWRREEIDVDNLLKLFLDALKKEGKGEGYEDYNFLIGDDSYFRGIRAEKEMVDSPNDQGVMFSYFVTKTFKIRDVQPICGEQLKKEYRHSWGRPMNLITASECRISADGERMEPEKKKYKFIDNFPGEVILLGKTKEEEAQGQRADMHPDAIPGYDWRKGDIVEGCMVFKRKPKSPQALGQDSEFYWLKKWHSPF